MFEEDKQNYVSFNKSWELKWIRKCKMFRYGNLSIYLILLIIDSDIWLFNYSLSIVYIYKVRFII